MGSGVGDITGSRAEGGIVDVSRESCWLWSERIKHNDKVVRETRHGWKARLRDGRRRVAVVVRGDLTTFDGSHNINTETLYPRIWQKSRQHIIF